MASSWVYFRSHCNCAALSCRCPALFFRLASEFVSLKLSCDRLDMRTQLLLHAAPAAHSADTADRILSSVHSIFLGTLHSLTLGIIKEARSLCLFPLFLIISQWQLVKTPVWHFTESSWSELDHVSQQNASWWSPGPLGRHPVDWWDKRGTFWEVQSFFYLCCKTNTAVWSKNIKHDAELR